MITTCGIKGVKKKVNITNERLTEQTALLWQTPYVTNGKQFLPHPSIDIPQNKLPPPPIFTRKSDTCDF